MEDLFSYSKYDLILCLFFDELGQFYVSRGSTKLIAMRNLKGVLYTDTNNGLDIPLKDMFIKYFEIYPKEENMQTKYERRVLSSVTEGAIQLKQDMIQDHGTEFETTQIIFCLPIEWRGEKYETALRALFLKAGWVTKEDHRNHLVFVKFVERLVNFWQQIDLQDYKTEREGKYLLCYLNGTHINYTCFQMQSANELVAVSRKLAASDFLLVPTILDDVTICLSGLDDTIYHRIKQIITSIMINRLKITVYYKRKRIMFKNTRGIIQTCGIKRKSKGKNIYNKGMHHFIEVIAKILGLVHRFATHYASDVYLDDMLSTHPLLSDDRGAQRFLKGWTGGSFRNEILNDSKVKQHIQEVFGSFREIISRYNSGKHSPEGVLDVFLVSGVYYHRSVYKELIISALLNEETISYLIGDDFMGFSEEPLCSGAMRKSHKMIQIANALLPPTVLNEQNLEDINLIEYEHETSILPPNSFYIQAYTREDCIYFILNKVVAVSTRNGATQKSTFTVQEKTVIIENITDLVCDNIWNHLQIMDFEGCRDRPLHACCAGELSFSNYRCFHANLKRSSSRWFQSDSKKLDMYYRISISNDCECTVNIPHYMLLKIGLERAISNIATTIASTVASNSFFGLYHVSALIIISDYEDTGKKFLKETIHKRLQIHQKRPVVLFGEQEVMVCETLGQWDSNKKQILGKGSYSQLSPTGYRIRYKPFKFENPRPYNGFYEYDGYSYKKVEMIGDHYVSEILERECLVYEGLNKRFILNDKHFNERIECFILDFSQVEGFCRIWNFYFRNILYSFPFTFSILPEHHLSAVKLEMSCIAYEEQPDNTIKPLFITESISIHERLVLKPLADELK